jgi:glyoxylase-like metal-dependent hydrolase (beta-lactamase superfamily II)
LPEPGVLLKPIVQNVYQIQLGVVNAYLIAGHDLTLIDTGTPGNAPQIMRAVEALGRSPAEIRHILLTHVHPDHTGSLAEVKRITGAAVYMHPFESEVLHGTAPGRCLQAAPGIRNRALTRLFLSAPPWRVAPTFVEHEVMDGDVLDCTGTLEAVHVPGHCAGQLAFLYHYRPNNGAVLFAADTASNMFGRLGLTIAYEDLQCGRRSLAKLAAMQFDVACFGHGDPIVGSASARFRAKWAQADADPPCD